jgi:hypothetical protein
MTYLASIAVDAAPELHAVRMFFDEHGEAIANATQTLGGPAASARYFVLAQAVRETLRLTRTQRRQLVDIHRLLTLRDVGAPEHLETALFAAIHPDSPIVDEICLLSDRLQELLVQISADWSEKSSDRDGYLYKEVA